MRAQRALKDWEEEGREDFVTQGTSGLKGKTAHGTSSQSAALPSVRIHVIALTVYMPLKNNPPLTSM